jgi:protein-tyrosine phosphatase
MAWYLGAAAPARATNDAPRTSPEAPDSLLMQGGRLRMAQVCGDGQKAAGASHVASLIRDISGVPGRHMAVPGTLNFRDAGGYPVPGGGFIAWRRLLRSDGLHDLGPGALEMLGGLGLRTVLDLRTSAEVEIAPTPIDAMTHGGALAIPVSLLGDDLTGMPADLTAIYDYVIDRRGPAIAAVVKSLARPGALPALVHCAAGKDRTGIVVAIALAAVGVPDPFIAADYALSSLYLDPQHTPTIGRVQESTGLGDRLTAALLASPPELILHLLARARRQSGSIDGYLAGHGVTRAELSALRSALVTDAERHDEGELNPDVSR